jgi:hypothetical protein
MKHAFPDYMKVRHVVEPIVVAPVVEAVKSETTQVSKTEFPEYMKKRNESTEVKPVVTEAKSSRYKKELTEDERYEIMMNRLKTVNPALYAKIMRMD